jgi:hypothetical protein
MFVGSVCDKMGRCFTETLPPSCYSLAFPSVTLIGGMCPFLRSYLHTAVGKVSCATDMSGTVPS